MRPFDLPEGKLYFAGEWREGRGAEITSTFPADRSLNRVLRGASAEDVDLAVEAAQRAQRDPSWRNLRPHERASYLYRIAEGIAREADRISYVQSRVSARVLPVSRDCT